MAWYRNKQTGVAWDAYGETLKRVQSDPKFEPCEAPGTDPHASAQAPGESAAEPVLRADGGGAHTPAAEPGHPPAPTVPADNSSKRRKSRKRL